MVGEVSRVIHTRFDTIVCRSGEPEHLQLCVPDEVMTEERKWKLKRRCVLNIIIMAVPKRNKIFDNFKC